MITSAAGFIYITALVRNGQNQSYETVKYKTTIYDPGYDYDLDSVPTNIDKEIIVRFSPKVIDTTFADNTGLTHGTIDEIITDQNLINQMDTLFGANGRMGDWMMRKLAPFLTTEDVFMTNRYGETEPLPPFCATYIMAMQTNQSEVAASELLETLPSWKVWWAHPNNVAKLTMPKESTSPPPPDDNLYSEQESLNSTMFPDAHINVEPVWDENIYGTSDITVAVFDTGLSFNHEDFRGDGSYGGLNGSVVSGGVDFNGDNTIFDDNDGDNNSNFNGHGSMVSGIIGALRNNNKGVSGIAGGDIANGDQGVNLQMYKVGGDGITISQSVEAVSFMLGFGPDMNAGALSLPDITNHSYGWTSGVGGSISPEALEEGFYAMYSAGLITVAGRGNEGNDDGFLPGTFDPDWLISVGSSGTDGTYKNGGNGIPIDSSDDDDEKDYYSSSYGMSMDLIAPGTKALITTTNNGASATIFPDFYCPATYDNLYTCFYGTSAAAPHVAGSAALILEYHQENHGTRLTSEDVEHLLNYGASDVVDQDLGYGPSYDEKNGWGLLNVSGSTALIDGDQNKKVYHIEAIPVPDKQCNFDNVGTEILSFDYPYVNPLTGRVYETGINYESNQIDYTYNLDIDLCSYWPGGGVSIQDLTDANKIEVWASSSRSTFWKPVNTQNSITTVRPEKELTWESGPTLSMVNNKLCRVEGVLTGSAFCVVGDNDPSTPLWTSPETIPNNGNNDGLQRMIISVLIDDPNDVTPDGPILLHTKEEPAIEELSISPNPSSGLFNVNYRTNSTENIVLSVSDLNGKMLLKLDQVGQITGYNTEVIDLTGFPTAFIYAN